MRWIVAGVLAALLPVAASAAEPGLAGDWVVDLSTEPGFCTPVRCS